MVKIEVFTKQNKQYISDATNLLFENFYHESKAVGKKEIINCLGDGKIVLAAVIDEHLVGFIGAIPLYANTGWELYPLLVSKAYHFQGIATLLIEKLEKEVANRGGHTLFLGIESVDAIDVFNNAVLEEADVFKKESIKDLSKHPYEFYKKLGYTVISLDPEASILGKNRLWLAKRLAK